MTEELKPEMIRAGVERLEQLLEAETGLSYTVDEVYRAMDAHRSPAWRDIESAPRDGDDPECLAWVDGIVEKVYWDGHGFVLDNEAWRGGPTQYVEPTHWMPLPQPPEEGRG